MKKIIGENWFVPLVAVDLGINDLQPVGTGMLQHLLKKGVLVGRKKPLKKAVCFGLCMQCMKSCQQANEK